MSTSNNHHQEVAVMVRIAVVLLSLALVSTGCAQVERVARQPPVTWIVAVDVTASQLPADFARYPAVGRAGALELLRPGDEIVILLLDGSPEPVVHSVRKIDHRLTTVRTAAREVYRELRALQLSRNKQGHTDLGAIVAHVGRRIELERAGGTGAAARAFRVVWVSDGLPTGRQSIADWRPFADADLRVAFFGALPAARPAVEALFARAGFAGADRLVVVEHSHVEQMLDHLPTFMGRRPNADLTAALTKDTGVN